MTFSIESKDLDFGAKTVVEYWRNIVPSSDHMSDDDILECILRFSLEVEFLKLRLNNA